MDRFDLSGKVALVTGGTRGIGYAIVKKFLESGASVTLCGSRKETVDRALEQLKKEAPDGDVSGIFPSLSDPEEVKAAIAEIKGKYGRLDILVNNAGISQSTSLEDYTPEEFNKIMELNVTSVFNCSQAAAAVMKEQGGGVILNTSSVVSLFGQPSGCGYPMSKYAVNGLTRSLARELASSNIRVNAVAPGVTNTDMVAGLPEKFRAPLLSKIPLGRFGEPEDIANAFAFLASDSASYITGVVLSVDGCYINN